MKHFIVNTNSWHYKMNLARLQRVPALEYPFDAAERYLKSRNNLCSYWQTTSNSLLQAFVSIIFLSLIAIGIIALLYFVVKSFITAPMFTFYMAGTIIGSVGILLSFIIMMLKLEDRRREKINRVLHEGETSLSVAKYQSWKSGICVPVDFIDAEK